MQVSQASLRAAALTAERTPMPPFNTGRNGEATSVEPDSGVNTEPVRRRRPFRLPVMSRVSIQSKLLVMLLLTSILSAAVVGFIGYQSGRNSLRASVFDGLTEIRQSQSRQLQAELSDLQNSLVVYTRGSTATEAIEAFTAAFDQLNNATITGAQQRSIVDYYNKVFAPTEDEQTGNQVGIAGLLPTSNTQKYLQAHYTVPFTDWDQALRFDDAHDGSAWSAASAKYNDFFREIVTRFEFEEELLLDTPRQHRLQRLQGRRPRIQHSQRPVQGRRPHRGVRQGHGIPRRRLCRHHRLRRLPARRRADGLDGVSRRPPGSRRGGAGPAIPDLEDQSVDDDGQAVGRIRDGQDRRDIHRRPGRPDALGLPAVSGGSGRVQARRDRRRYPTRRGPGIDPSARHHAGAARRHGSHPACAARPAGHAHRGGLPRSRDTAGLCTSRSTRPALVRHPEDRHLRSVRTGVGVHAHIGAVH